MMTADETPCSKLFSEFGEKQYRRFVETPWGWNCEFKSKQDEWF